jgi:quinol monooxygenase YgiN
MITMIAHMRVRAENAAAYEALMDEVAQQTLNNEPGVAYYAWSKSDSEPDTYVVIEVYENAEVHAAHMASPWVQASIPKSIVLVDGKFDIRQYVSGGSQPVRLTMTR